MSLIKYVAGLAVATVLTACGGGGGSGSGPATTASAPVVVPTANATVASITINTTSAALNADGTSTKTFTIFALTSGNAVVSGATIDLSATNGVIISTPSVVTTTSGATVTMTAASADQTNRISTLTASCKNCLAGDATSLVTVTGASIVLTNSGSSSLINGGASSTLSALVKDVSGVAMPAGISVSFASTDPLVLGLGATTVPTNSFGIATVSVSGLTTGSASINVTALGNAKAQAFNSAPAASLLVVTSPANNDTMVTGGQKPITVSAPGASNVIFATTLGIFDNGLASKTVAVVGGTASVTLTSSQAGTATINVRDDLSTPRTTSLSLVISPPIANRITLTSLATTLPVSTATNQSSVTVKAHAEFDSGTGYQSVANIPIVFTMQGGPSAGERLTNALVYTDSAGNATTTFIAGISATDSNGISISAKVNGSETPGPVVQTGTSPSSSNLQLIIGGQALSVAFGSATGLLESTDLALYTMAYRVQVTDSGNNPVDKATVSLRMRPVAFSLGSACTVTATYCSEDWNGNGSLDIGEDGVRIPTSVATAGSCPNTSATVVAANTTAVAAVLAAGGLAPTKDTNLTPSNSDGGSVPATVITGPDGTASFTLTYLKNSAYWLVNKLTATVSSNGTETSNSTIFRLTALEKDVKPTCYLPPSPYSY